MLLIWDYVKWMTLGEMALWLIAAAVLVRVALVRSPAQRRSWLDGLASLGIAVAAACLLYGILSPGALALYVLNVILFLCTLGRLRPAASRRSAARPRRRVWRVLGSLCGLILLVFALITAGELRYNPRSDFSALGYTDAFLRLNERLAAEYPFGERKGIDWAQRARDYEPKFREAEQKQDAAAYYKLLRGYVYTLRDGHVRIAGERLYEDNAVFRQEAGGGFGLSTLLLDDGRVMVSLVLDNSPAAAAGIRPGAELLSWGGRPAAEAYRSTVWSEGPAATEESRRLNQGRFLVRAAIGQEVEATVRGPGPDQAARSVTLKAVDDQYASLLRSRNLPQPEASAGPVIEGRLLDGNVGYIRIRRLIPDGLFHEPRDDMAALLQGFRTAGVQKLVLDVRDNGGGFDQMAADLSGYFLSQEKFYEQVSYYNRHLRRFEVNPGETIMAKPAESPYTGQLAVLINARTASSGEGIPLMLRGEPHVRMIGVTGTSGSFGLVSRPIRVRMPGGYELQFPDGRSLDANGHVQVDSDGRGEGGVAPDLRIPLDDETFRRAVIEGEDVELAYALSWLREDK